MYGVMTPTVFSVWDMGAAVYQSNLAVAQAIDQAEVLGVHHFDLLADSYKEVSPDSQLGYLYWEYLQDVIEGRQPEAAFLKRQLAGLVRRTDEGKWLEVVERAGLRVQQKEDSAFLQMANRRFFVETKSMPAGGMRPVPPAQTTLPETIAGLQSSVEQGYQQAMDRLVALAGRGNEVAQEAMRTANPRKLEQSDNTPWSQWCLATLAEWGNVKAVWSLTRLAERRNSEAEEMLTTLDPTALARRAEAGEEEAQRAVTALAFCNPRAMNVLGDWILAGRRDYARLLCKISVRDEATTRAIDELARVAQQNFEHLEWLFRLLEDFSVNPGGDRYKRTLDHLRSFDLTPLTAAAGKNVPAFRWLVKLNAIGHPLALQEAAALVEPLSRHLKGKNSPAIDLLFRGLSPQVGKALGLSKGPYAPAVLGFLRRPR